MKSVMDDVPYEITRAAERYLEQYGDPIVMNTYAVTSHSAQGLTAERVLIHADTSVHPDLLSSRFGYVAVSRASHEATIFTDDVTRLAQHLGTEVSKSSALEINQNRSTMTDQSISIAM